MLLVWSISMSMCLSSLEQRQLIKFAKQNSIKFCLTAWQISGAGKCMYRVLIMNSLLLKKFKRVWTHGSSKTYLWKICKTLLLKKILGKMPNVLVSAGKLEWTPSRQMINPIWERDVANIEKCMYIIWKIYQH